jgi:hypothetical protein
MDVRLVTGGRCRRRRAAAALMAVVAGAAATGCSSSSPSAGTLAPSTTGAPAATSTEPEGGPEADLAEVQALWESVLAALEAAPDQRPANLAALAPAVAVTLDERTNGELPVDPSELTSNARFDQSEPDRITIADCAASSESSLLGFGTVGLRAAATRTGDGEPWVLGELETARNCVPKDQADAALAAYNAFLPEYNRLWTEIDPEDPGLEAMTEQAKAALVESFTIFQREGWYAQNTIIKETAEVIGVALDGAIVLSTCTNYGPGSGVFKADGTPVPELTSTEFSLSEVRMVPQGSTWIFDGVTYVGDACLFAPTDQQATLL